MVARERSSAPGRELVALGRAASAAPLLEFRNVTVRRAIGATRQSRDAPGRFGVAASPRHGNTATRSRIRTHELSRATISGHERLAPPRDLRLEAVEAGRGRDVHLVPVVAAPVHVRDALRDRDDPEML